MMEIEGPEKKETSWLTKKSKALEIGIAVGCGRLALGVSRYPGRTIWISVLVCALLSIGWINVDDESNVEKLYTPQKTRAFADRDWVEDRFGDAATSSVVYLNRKEHETNLLDKEALIELFDIYNLVTSIGVDDIGYDQRKCAQVYWTNPYPRIDPYVCQKESILAFWDYNLTKLEEDDDIIATINGEAGDCCSPSSRTVDLSSVAAKLHFDGDRVVRVGAWRMAFYLTTDLHRKSREDPENKRLERKFQAKLRRRSYEYFQKPLPSTEYGYEKNSSDAFDTDRVFINFAIIIILIYAFVALYSFKNKERSRGILGLGAVLTVVLSTAAAFGVVIASGVTFSPSTGVAIFLVLGIGLDDSFVICGAVDDPFDDDDDYDPTLSPLVNDAKKVMNGGGTIEDVAGRRIVHTLASSGPSITVTSITDAAAFVAGSFTATPDISSFNRFCACSVIVDFVMQLTFFVALFTLDQRRRLRLKIKELEGDKSGCCSLCCSSTVEKRVADDDDEDDGGKEEAPVEADPVDTLKDIPLGKDVEKSEIPKSVHPDPAVRFWGETYASKLLSPFGKIFVLSSFVMLLTLGVVGISRLEMDIEDNWGIVSNPERKVVDFEKKYFGSGIMPVGIYTKRTDYFANKDAFRAMLRGYVEDLNFVEATSLEDNWFEAHETWINETSRQVTNYDEWLVSLRAFLDGDGADYSLKVSFDENNDVRGAEIDTFWEADGSFGGDGKRRMRKARKEVRGTALGTVIVYNNNFIWNESFVVILRDTVFAMSLACAVVLTILILLLGDLVAAFMVACSVAFVCVNTLGAVYWYNDGVNYITSFFIVIAIGLSADAPAHVMHAYLESRLPTRQERAQEALKKLGPSVFRGGLSTILGIAITGFCVTYVFTVFFKMLMTILVLALYSGLAIMPVVCSLIGPMPSHDVEALHA